jgi:glycosyltransferase involved in cell wall biosynthesis
MKSNHTSPERSGSGWCDIRVCVVDSPLVISQSQNIKPYRAAANTVVVIPAYNESRFIGSVVLAARRYAARVIVVDDGSRDSTSQLAEAAGAIVLRHAANHGKAAALTTAFRHVQKLYKKSSRIKVVITIDGDGQQRCDEIPGLSAPILAGEADIVVGSRFLEVKSRIPKWRVFGQRALTVATNLSSGFNLTDSQSGYRAFSPKVLDKLDFEAEGFSVESEMQFLARQNNLRVTEAPISSNYDEPPKRNPVRQGVNVLNGILKFTGQYRPFLFFSVPGIICVLSGIGLGIDVVERFNSSGHLAAGLAMICLLLSIVGMILISTGFTLHSIRGLLIDLLRVRH